MNRIVKRAVSRSRINSEYFIRKKANDDAELKKQDKKE